jgi:hypothetical protein
MGLILCRSKNRIIAEYALRDLTKPIGVSGYVTKLVESLPKALRGIVPSVAELEKEFTKELRMRAHGAARREWWRRSPPTPRNANGVGALRPGLRVARYPGSCVKMIFNPRRVASPLPIDWIKPRWGWAIFGQCPQGICSKNSVSLVNLYLAWQIRYKRSIRLQKSLGFRPAT